MQGIPFGFRVGNSIKNKRSLDVESESRPIAKRASRGLKTAIFHRFRLKQRPEI